MALPANFTQIGQITFDLDIVVVWNGFESFHRNRRSHDNDSTDRLTGQFHPFPFLAMAN